MAPKRRSQTKQEKNEPGSSKKSEPPSKKNEPTSKRSSDDSSGIISFGLSDMLKTKGRQVATKAVTSGKKAALSVGTRAVGYVKDFYSVKAQFRYVIENIPELEYLFSKDEYREMLEHKDKNDIKEVFYMILKGMKKHKSNAKLHNDVFNVLSLEMNLISESAKSGKSYFSKETPPEIESSFGDMFTLLAQHVNWVGNMIVFAFVYEVVKPPGYKPNTKETTFIKYLSCGRFDCHVTSSIAETIVPIAKYFGVFKTLSPKLKYIPSIVANYTAGKRISANY
jgi:hypothetical protein